MKRGGNKEITTSSSDWSFESRVLSHEERHELVRVHLEDYAFSFDLPTTHKKDRMLSHMLHNAFAPQKRVAVEVRPSTADPSYHDEGMSFDAFVFLVDEEKGIVVFSAGGLLIRFKAPTATLEAFELDTPFSIRLAAI